MDEKKEKPEVFQVTCPCCHSVLWIDPGIREVIRSEKGKRKKESLEELLSREKKRKEEFERKFEATAELEKKKKEKIKDEFEKALSELRKKE